jgi:hypothetical protein
MFCAFGRNHGMSPTSMNKLRRIKIRKNNKMSSLSEISHP